jgi:hypothetical protein
VFYLHLGNENLVPLQNLNPSLVFVCRECSFLFAQGYPLKRVFYFHTMHMKRQVNSTFAAGIWNEKWGLIFCLKVYVTPI